VKLYEARGGKVQLSEAGERTRNFAHQLFSELKVFQTEIAKEDCAVTVVLSAEATLQRYHLPNVIDAFSRSYPLARLRLLSRRPNESLDLVRRNDADLGLVNKLALPPDVKFHPWRTFKSYILIPHGHPIAQRGKLDIEDVLNEEALSSHPQIVAEMDDQAHSRIKEGLEGLGLPYNVQLEVGNIDTVKHYVARGHGIAVVSGVCLLPEDDLRFHKIEIPKSLDSETTYGIILREDKHIAPPLEFLLSSLGYPARRRG
jgi:DNA-binding transcriptional LysR family regulator